MGYGINLSTWRGHNINDGTTYVAHFLVEGSEVLNTLGAQAVEIQRPQNSPLRAYSQPMGMRFEVEIVVAGALSQANLDQLKQWFSPLETDLGALVGTADSGSGSARRLMCVVEKLDVKQGEGTNVFTALMYAPTGLWEDNTATAPSATTVNESPEAISLSNAGNANTPLVLVITAASASTETQSKMKPAFVANRSVEALQHFANEKYPVEITGGGIDTTSDFMANLNDLRVLLNGDEIPRWCQPTTSNAATKVWVNAHWEPGKFASLAAAIDGDDNTLTVNNPEGFAGWPENAWLFVDDEPMLATGISGFGVTSLYRPYPTTHDPDAPIWWIEHVFNIIHDDADASAVPDWSDQEPVIDRTVSTNAFHKLAGPFFNAENLRSRTALRRLPDSGESHIRTYDDGDGKLRWEDLPAEAGKPPLSVIELDFPVPLTELEFDYEVEQSLVLSVKGTDYGRDGGFVSDERTALWTSGELTDETITPANPLKRLEIEAKVGAVVGEIDTDGVTVISTLNQGANQRVENPFYDTVSQEVQDYSRQIGQLVAEHASPFSSATRFQGVPASLKRSQNITINMPAFIHFVIEKETRIDGLLLYTTGGTGYFYFSNGSPEKKVISFTIASGSAQLRTVAFDPPIVLSAGEYWIRPGGAFGVIAGRRDPNLWWGYHDVFAERTQTYEFSFTGDVFYLSAPPNPEIDIQMEWDESAEVDVPTRDSFHQDFFENTPIFALLSSETEPDPSAPTETGLIATIDNLRCTLDSDVAPLIYVGASVDINLLDGTVENSTTDQAAQILYPLKVGETITINTETAEVTDGETDLPITYAVAYSEPLNRLQLAPGSNSLAATDLEGTTIGPTYRGRYL